MSPRVRPRRAIRTFSSLAAPATVASLWGAGALAITAPSAAAAPVAHRFDADADRNGVADCWFTNPWGGQSSSAWLTSGRSGRAQVLSGVRFASGASLRLAQEGRCALPVVAGQRVRSAVWYQASGPAEMWIESRSSRGTWNMVRRTAIPRSSSWARLDPAEVVMPAGTTAARVQFRLTGVGRLTVDDLSVEKVTANQSTAPTTPNTPTTPGTSATGVLFAPIFPSVDRLITNEYAFWSGSAGNAVKSPEWRVTSGSLFSRGGTAWTGVPDDREPNATSSTGTNSAIFRAITPPLSTADVGVQMALRINRMTSTPSTPQVAWDGVHMFLRYQSEYSLYYASVARRDGSVVLKKKCAGGSSNGGTYYTLGSRSAYPLPAGTWAGVGATAKNNVDGSVTLSLQRGGQTILSAVDRGIGCSPIRSAGSTGVRGDNTDFQFGDFMAAAR